MYHYLVVEFLHVTQSILSRPLCDPLFFIKHCRFSAKLDGNRVEQIRAKCSQHCFGSVDGGKVLPGQ